MWRSSLALSRNQCRAERLWPFPLWFVALYVFNFDRFIFTADDQRRFDELVARYGASDGDEGGAG